MDKQEQPGAGWAADERRTMVIGGLSIALGLCIAGIVYLARTSEPAPITVPKPAPVRVKMETSMGEMVLELDPEHAPDTVKNFLGYVDSGHYAGTIFHRVVKPSAESTMAVIQGGGFDDRLIEKPTRPPIALETSDKLRNDRGTIAMARTFDPNSATAQFYINLVNNDFLNAAPGNPGYAVFGKVVQGMDVADAIGKVETGAKGIMTADVPQKTVTITRVSRM